MITFIVVLIFILIIITLLLKAKDLYKEAMLRAIESKKKGEKITKTIETNLMNQDKLQYGKIETASSQSGLSVPIKPSTVVEYNESEIGEVGLPGMEIVQS